MITNACGSWSCGRQGHRGGGEGQHFLGVLQRDHRQADQAVGLHLRLTPV